MCILYAYGGGSGSSGGSEHKQIRTIRFGAAREQQHIRSPMFHSLFYLHSDTWFGTSTHLVTALLRNCCEECRNGCEETRFTRCEGWWEGQGCHRREGGNEIEDWISGLYHAFRYGRWMSIRLHRWIPLEQHHQQQLNICEFATIYLSVSLTTTSPKNAKRERARVSQWVRCSDKGFGCAHLCVRSVLCINPTGVKWTQHIQ